MFASVYMCGHTCSCAFLQEAIAALRQQLQQKPQQQPGPWKAPPPCPVQTAALDASAAADSAPAATNAAIAAAAKDQPATATTAAAAASGAGDQSTSKAEAKAAAAAEVAALRDMESQLARLSGIVKSYQGEREQLRQALMAGVAERQALQHQVRLR